MVHEPVDYVLVQVKCNNVNIIALYDLTRFEKEVNQRQKAKVHPFSEAVSLQVTNPCPLCLLAGKLNLEFSCGSRASKI